MHSVQTRSRHTVLCFSPRLWLWAYCKLNWLSFLMLRGVRLEREDRLWGVANTDGSKWVLNTSQEMLWISLEHFFLLTCRSPSYLFMNLSCNRDKYWIIVFSKIINSVCEETCLPNDLQGCSVLSSRGCFLSAGIVELSAGQPPPFIHHKGRKTPASSQSVTRLLSWKRCADHRLHDPIDTCSRVTVNMFNRDAEKLDMISHLTERFQSDFFILPPFIQMRHDASGSNFAWHMGESADWLKVKCEAFVELDLLIDRGQTVM